MVFQKPNPFPMSIYDNIAYGPRIHGIKDKKILDKIVEESLRGAAIWDEVKDRLKTSALRLIWRTTTTYMYSKSYSYETRSNING